jgi:hypothetical protein
MQAPMAHPAEPVVAAGPVDPVDPVEQFQAMAVMVASRATVELEVTAELVLQARTGRIPEILAQPEGMEEVAQQEDPAVMAASEVLPKVSDQLVRMALVETAALVARQAQPEMAAMVPLEMRPHPTEATVARAGIPEQLG